MKTKLSIDVIKRLPLVVPTLFAVAIAATIVAANSAQKLTLKRAEQKSELQLVSSQASQAELKSIADKLKVLTPGLQIDVTGRGLRIAGEAGTYPIWAYALASVPALNGKLLWTADRLCVNKCGGTNLYQAEITATRQVLQRVVEEKGDDSATDGADDSTSREIGE